jgi:hypothetical protein
MSEFQRMDKATSLKLVRRCESLQLFVCMCILCDSVNRIYVRVRTL